MPRRKRLVPSAQVNISLIRRRLGDPPDLVVRRLPIAGRHRVFLLYIEHCADKARITEGTASAILDQRLSRLRNKQMVLERLAGHFSSGDAGQTQDVEAVALRLIRGAIVILVNGLDRACHILLYGAEGRHVERSEVETATRGSQESFVERVFPNLALIRTRLSTPDLRVKEFVLGRRSQTRVYLLWVDTITDPEIVAEAESRLSRIDVDIVYDLASLLDHIEDNPIGVWPQAKATERPDVVAANLCEGRFAILIDGTPFAIVAPVVLGQMMQAVDDYSARFMVSSWIRTLRYLALVLSLIGPAAYVALTTYHQELIPPLLAISLAAGREAVPFPAAAEAIGMRIGLDLLIEAGLRLPRVIGPAVSIVGALVLGQAAVNAGLIGPAMVIVIAGTGIAGFAIPDFALSETTRYLSYFIIIVAAAFGLVGIAWIMLLLYIGLVDQRSFGVPLLYPLAPGRVSEWKDIFIRFPYWANTRRPRLLTRDVVRAEATPPGPPKSGDRRET